jgi:hypothetical protein
VNLLSLMQFKTIMALALIIGALLILRSLVNRDKSAGSRLLLDDLLLGDDGKWSKAATVMLGAFSVTTWMMVYLTLRDKITEGYLGIYVAAWIAPTVTRLVTGPKAEITTESVTATSTTTKPAGE